MNGQRESLPENQRMNVDQIEDRWTDGPRGMFYVKARMMSSQT